jgi:phosphatidylserine/phosphatidylglycerophosphate/cardiolipin synthase-like enzyme
MIRRFVLLSSLCVLLLPAVQADSVLTQAKSVPGISSVPVPTEQRIEAGFSPEGSAEKLILKILDTAKVSIRLSAYSFTSPKVVRALLDAQKRGVDIAVVVDEKGNKSKTSIQALNLLVKAKIPTRTISKYAINHDKYIIVDARHLETGSFNFSAAANKRNSENVLVVWNNPALAHQYFAHWSSRYVQGVDYRFAD